MLRPDFRVDWDPKTETEEDLSRKIVHSIVIKTMEANKPVVLFVSGGSGEGKSWGSLRLMEVLMQSIGQDFSKHMDDINVYVPIEYPDKLKKLLFDKKLKKIPFICLHEARNIIKASLWHSFINQAISDVNAMSRAVKRMCTIIISQSIKDISKDMRLTVSYYIKSYRFKDKQAKTRFKIYRIWLDDTDLETPKIRKAAIRGIVRAPGGKFRALYPKALIMNKPTPKVIERFTKSDVESKSDIIKHKMHQLITEMKRDVGMSDKVDKMVEHYSKNPDELQNICQRKYGKWKLSKDAIAIHDLTPSEIKDFTSKLVQKMQEKGIIQIKEEVKKAEGDF